MKRLSGECVCCVHRKECDSGKDCANINYNERNIMNGKKVKIQHTSVTGVVTAELHEDTGYVQFRVRYEDKNGLVVDQWYDQKSLTIEE